MSSVSSQFRDIKSRRKEIQERLKVLEEEEGRLRTELEDLEYNEKRLLRTQKFQKMVRKEQILFCFQRYHQYQIAGMVRLFFSLSGYENLGSRMFPEKAMPLSTDHKEDMERFQMCHMERKYYSEDLPVGVEAFPEVVEETLKSHRGWIMTLLEHLDKERRYRHLDGYKKDPDRPPYFRGDHDYYYTPILYECILYIPAVFFLTQYTSRLVLSLNQFTIHEF